MLRNVDASILMVTAPRYLERFSSSLFVAVLFALGNSGAWGAATNDVFADFDEYANAALVDWQTPGMAIAVIKGDAVVFARGYGVRKLGNTSLVDTNTVFPIASITKLFNATGLATFVDEGRLKWNDPVTKYLPEFQLRDAMLTREVSVADLLAHRTRLKDPDILSYTGSVDRIDLIRRAKFLKQDAPFRTGYGYNNLMVVVSGEILERISGESWAHFVERRIFEPLKMNSTVADVQKLQDAKNVATVYVAIDGQLKEDRSWTLPLNDGWRRVREAIRPAGAICSTVLDMTKFMMFHLSDGNVDGKQILKGDTILEMQALHSVLAVKAKQNQKLPYPQFLSGWGLGWEIRDYRGRKVVMHRGSTGAVLAMMPEEKIGVVVLTNRDCGMQYMVMHDVFDRLLGIPRSWSNQDWISEVIDKYQQETDTAMGRLEAGRHQEIAPKFPLDRYAGVYESDLYGKMVIGLTNGKLTMELGPNCIAELKHWQGERFRARFVVRYLEDWFLTFSTTEKGRITGLDVEQVQPRKLISTFRRAPNNVEAATDSLRSR